MPADPTKDDLDRLGQLLSRHGVQLGYFDRVVWDDFVLANGSKLLAATRERDTLRARVVELEAALAAAEEQLAGEIMEHHATKGNLEDAEARATALLEALRKVADLHEQGDPSVSRVARAAILPTRRSPE